MGTYLDAKVECQLDRDIPLFFELDRCWTEKVRLEVDDMILTVNPDGSLRTSRDLAVSSASVVER